MYKCVRKELPHAMTPHSNPVWGSSPQPPQHSQKLARMHMTPAPPPPSSYAHVLEPYSLKTLASHHIITTAMHHSSYCFKHMNTTHTFEISLIFMMAGADPGIFVRGVQPSENFWQAKKNTTKRGEGGGGGLQYLFCFSMVVDICRQKHIWDDCLSFVKLENV